MRVPRWSPLLSVAIIGSLAVFLWSPGARGPLTTLSPAQRADPGRASLGATGTEEPAARHAREGAGESLRWSGRFRSRAEGAPLAGLEVTVVLLSEDGETERRELVSGPEGECGPLTIDLGRFGGAQVVVAPGLQNAAAEFAVAFDAAGERVDEFLVGARVVLEVGVHDGDLPAVAADVTLARAGRTLWTRPVDDTGRVVEPWREPGHDFSLSSRKAGRASLFDASLPDAPTEDVLVELLLRPVAALDVRVLDGEVPVGEGVTVRVAVARRQLPTARAAGLALVPSVWRVSTARDGVARFTDLPCEVVLEVAAGSGARDAVELEHLTCGVSAQLELQLGRPEPAVVQVVNLVGEPLPNARVGAGSRELGRTDERGRIRVDWREVSDGPGFERFLWAVAPGYALGWIGADEGRPWELIRLRLEPEGVIAGTVVDEGETPQRNVTARALPAGLEGRTQADQVRARLWTELWSEAAGARHGTDGYGRFRLGGLPPGDYDLEFRLPRGRRIPVQGVPTGTRNLHVVVTDDQAGPAFSVAVVDATSGAPLPGAEVRVVRYEAPAEAGRHWSNEITHARTGPDGTALVRTSGPGWFDVSADAPGYAPAEAEAREGEAGVQHVAFELSRAGQLECRVTDVTGAPFAGAYVSLVDARGARLTLIQRSPGGGTRSGDAFSTDTGGWVRSAPCRVGRYTVEVRSGREVDARLLVRGEVVVTAGRRATVELQVVP